MLVEECLTSKVHTVDPQASLRVAAVQMATHDVGSLPVSDANNERLVGMVTDRDIAIRGIGRAWGPEAQISDVMSQEVLYCRSDDEVDAVLDNMAQNQIRRLPVVSDEKRLVGIVSISDLTKADPDRGGASLSRVAEPSDKHSQSLERAS